jgi:hypothetical protein
VQIGGSLPRPTPGINEEPIQKIPIAKRSGGMVQVVEYLSVKYKTLNSKPSTAKKM